MTASQFINSNEHRRGAIPTPDGALPLQRRRRKGMLNLKAWDEHVAATNLANGTSSNTEKVDILQMITPNATQKAEELINTASLRVEEAPPPVCRPRDPDEADETVNSGTPPPAMTSGAILEDAQIAARPAPVTLPPASPEAIATAKAMLAAEEAASKIPPPPKSAPAKRQPKTTADQ